MRQSRPRIVIVGVCGSGKSVLAQSLQGLGYNARSMAQEHSFVPGMWRAHGQPNVLICLGASAETINRRLGRADWTAVAVAEQHGRLADAMSCCDLFLDTDPLTEGQVLQQVVSFLRAGWPDAEQENGVPRAEAASRSLLRRGHERRGV